LRPQESRAALSAALASARAPPLDARTSDHIAAICARLGSARRLDLGSWRGGVVPYLAPGHVTEAEAEQVARAMLAE
jgi:hypothetical protein